MIGWSWIRVIINIFESIISVRHPYCARLNKWNETLKITYIAQLFDYLFFVCLLFTVERPDALITCTTCSYMIVIMQTVIRVFFVYNKPWGNRTERNFHWNKISEFWGITREVVLTFWKIKNWPENSAIPARVQFLRRILCTISVHAENSWMHRVMCFQVGSGWPKNTVLFCGETSIKRSGNGPMAA